MNINSLKQLQRLYPEDQLLQGHSVQLWDGLVQEVVLEAVAREQVDADSRHHPAGPSGALLGVGFGHPDHLQGLHVTVGVETGIKKPFILKLLLTSINHRC